MNRTRATQAQRIVDTLSAWVSASPGEREVSLRETPDGWEAELLEKRKARGSTAIDALSQVATAAAVLETAERAT